jgi:hypothetical protein
LENIVDENKQIHNEQNTPERHFLISNAGAERRKNQEIPLRPLNPLLTHTLETAQTGAKITPSNSADLLPTNTSFESNADSDLTKYNRIASTPITCKKL